MNKNKNKSVFFFIINIFLFLGCARTPKTVTFGGPSGSFSQSRQGLQFEEGTKEKVTPFRGGIISDASLVFHPIQEQDCFDLSFRSTQEATWNKIFFKVKTPSFILKEDSCHKKIKTLVNILLSASWTKDYWGQEEKKQQPILSQANLEKDFWTKKRKNFFQQFTCFHPKKNTQTGKGFFCKTSLDSGSEVSSKTRKVPSACPHLKLVSFPLDSDKALEKKRLSLLVSCEEEISKIQLKEKEWEEKAEKINQRLFEISLEKENINALIIDVYQQIDQFYPPKRKFFSAVASSSKLIVEKSSKILFDSSLKEIKEFFLIIDFYGHVQTFSLENKNVSEVKIEHLSNGVIAFSFLLQAKDFRLEAKRLTLSSHSLLGKKIVGDIFLYYPDGLKRKGFIKLEY